MTKIKIKEFDNLEQLKRLVAYKLSEKLGFGTLVLDPYGSQLLLLLDTAERWFGREAREELEEFLLPYHKVRVLQTLQMEGLKSKWWIVAPSVGAKPEQDEDEDIDFSTSNEKTTLDLVSREQDPVSRKTAKVEESNKIIKVDNIIDEDFEEEEEDDDLLFE